MADDRTEARRLWRMMNRGGQMGMNVTADPLAYAGGASVVPPLYSQFLPAPRDPQTGEDLGWMNQDERGRFYRHQEQFPEGEDMGWSDYDPAAVHFRADLPRIQGQVDAQGYIGPYGRPDLAAAAQARRDAIFGTSVVAPPRMPTANETVRGVMGPANERDAAFSRIHDAYYTGADFGYEQGWSERLNVPSEYIDLYMAVPDEAKQYARDNPTDAILQQFEEKYGFPLDVSIDISM